MVSVEEPRNARSRRTRAALLDAARRVIELDGFAALTMARVADDAGVSRRGVYVHFPTRADLVTDLCRHIDEQEGLERSVGVVWQAPDSVQALHEWAHHLARFHPRLLAVLRANDEVRRTDEAAARLWDLIMRDWMRGCRRLARWLDTEGRLAPPWTAATAADMLWALMSYDVMERLVVERGWSVRQLGDHLAALLHRTFVSPPS